MEWGVEASRDAFFYIVFIKAWGKRSVTNQLVSALFGYDVVPDQILRQMRIFTVSIAAKMANDQLQDGVALPCGLVRA
ncbi:UNVERIFIED_CONTAM: hypothetical protein ABIE34_001395 [Jeotgalibacillus campisalis]